MYIDKIELKDFRNYENLDINLNPLTNILYGNNAQGKTNILESIYVGGTTKSHRGSKDRDMVRFSCDEAHIRINLIKNDIDYKIDMHLRKNKTKVISINGVNIKKASELLGILNIVFFSPEDLSIIKDGPSERRKFIDMELSQLDPYYLHNISNYNKAVNQRNKILKDMASSPDLDSILDVWDEQVINFGKNVIERRKSFIDELNEIITKIHSNLTGNKETCRLYYKANCSIEEFSERLKSSRQRDILYKTTNIGPHHDDLIFKASGIDVRKFGSQGQQRTAALSLKLSEIELVKKKIKDNPVLLLDDVLSELDSSRQNFLLDSIGDIQTIITCTGLDDFITDRLKIDKTFFIEEGKVVNNNL